MQYAVGIDIGGTKIAAALVGRDGSRESYRQIPTPASEGPQTIMRAVTSLVQTLLDTAVQQRFEVIGIGVGAAGQINVDTGVVTHAVETLPGWTGTGIAAQLLDTFGLPVVADNDVNAMAMAELQFGAGHSLQSTLTLGSGPASAGR